MNCDPSAECGGSLLGLIRFGGQVATGGYGGRDGFRNHAGESVGAFLARSKSSRFRSLDEGKPVNTVARARLGTSAVGARPARQSRRRIAREWRSRSSASMAEDRQPQRGRRWRKQSPDSNRIRYSKRRDVAAHGPGSGGRGSLDDVPECPRIGRTRSP